MQFNIEFYRKASGDCPVAEFLVSMNEQMRYKMMRCLDKVETYGNNPKSDVSKHVGDGIFEIRAQTRTDISRIFFFFDKDRQVVLTNGFIKKTERMPVSEFEAAKRYRNDYYNREKERLVEQRRAKNVEIVTAGPKWRPKLDQIIQETNLMKKSRKNDRQTRSNDSRSIDELL